MTIDDKHPKPITAAEILDACNAVRNAVLPIFQAISAAAIELHRRLEETRRQRIEWIRSDEGQRELAYRADIREIRQIAAREHAAGSRAITRMFDEKYAELGLTRQETRR